MRTILLVFLILLVAPLGHADTSIVAETPQITDEPLLNPGMGLYFMPGLNEAPGRNWYDDITSVAYFRVSWAAVEPKEGDYRFDDVFGKAFDYWIGRGKRVAFRIMPASFHSRERYVTPKWVFDAGVPGVDHKGLFGDQIDPAYWHPVYIRKQIAFIRAMGKRYNGVKGLEFVDIGAVGEWGESHLGRWSFEDKESTGYTSAAYTRAYLQFIDAYREAFPDTPLALNCVTGGAGENDMIVDYAVSKGIMLRQDGLTSASELMASRYYKAYGSRVKTNYELRGSCADMIRQDKTVLPTFKRGLKDGISYLNIMFTGDLKGLGQESRDACRYAASHIGYRLAPVSVQHPVAIDLVRNAQPTTWLKITWRNRGCAPCYKHYAVEISLWSSNGDEVHKTTVFSSVPTTQWLPGQDVAGTFSLFLPQDLRPGDYTWKVSLVDPLNDAERLLLPLKNPDKNRRYTIAKISVRDEGRAVSSAVTIPGADLAGQSDLKKWVIAQGISAAITTSKGPTGKPSLLLEGHSASGWSYSYAPRIALTPGVKYRLSGFMKVLEVDGVKSPPAVRPGERWEKSPGVKIGLHDGDGAWLTNIDTPRYDVSKIGTWQKLERTFTTDAGVASGYFAVEKYTDGPRQAKIMISDIRLEALGPAGKLGQTLILIVDN